MADPERYSKILRETSEILDKRVVELKLLLEERKRLENRKRIVVDFGMDDCDAYLTTEPYIHYYDSLTVEPDSVSAVYRLRNIHLTDTLYEGLRMVIDTLGVKDTVIVEDIEDDDDDLRERPSRTELDEESIVAKETILPEKASFDTSSRPRALERFTDLKNKLKLDTLKRI
jgi:hypothetical protein